MNKTNFFRKYGELLVVADEDNCEFGDFLFLHPEDIDRVKEFNNDKHQIVSVHETEDEEDFVDMGDIDFGNQPFKYGYFVLKRP